MKLLLQTTGDTKTKTNKLQSVNPSVSCIVQHKKSTLTLNLLELRRKLKNRKRERGTDRGQRGWEEKTRVASQEREGKKWPHRREEATGNIRKQSASLVREPLVWLESTSYRHGYRKLVKDVFFFFRVSRRRARVQAERVRQRGVWLALCKKRFVGSVGKSSLQFSSFCSFSILF